jgi:hypothetical protein
VRVGGGGEWRTCAMRDDEPRPVWMSLPITRVTSSMLVFITAVEREFVYKCSTVCVFITAVPISKLFAKITYYKACVCVFIMQFPAVRVSCYSDRFQFTFRRRCLVTKATLPLKPERSVPGQCRDFDQCRDGSSAWATLPDATSAQCRDRAMLTRRPGRGASAECQTNCAWVSLCGPASRDRAGKGFTH